MLFRYQDFLLDMLTHLVKCQADPDSVRQVFIDLLVKGKARENSDIKAVLMC